jgi:hypothetical protein
MLPEVGEHVHERTADRARRRERASVVASVPDLATPAKRAIHRPGEPDGEAADTAEERPSAIGLGDEVDVILLDGKLHDPKVWARSRDDGAADGREDPAGTEATERRHRAQGDMQGMGGNVRRASAVWNPGAATGRELAAGAPAAATPRWWGG